MRTRIQELPGPALAGGIAVIGGVALWQLGVECERAWLRSYDGPLEGETPAGEPLLAQRAPGAAASQASLSQALPAAERERRWVTARQPRRSLRARAS